MIGHDLVSDTDNINNMYKSTQNYGDEKNKPIPSVNWITQWETLMREFPKVKFIKVNPNGIRGNTPVNTNIEEWNNKSILSGLMESQQKAFDSVKNSLGEIENAVSLAVKKIQKHSSSKIVYVGSGTSGRIGMLDGVELIPTFGWSNERLKFCFSGKDVSKPSEGSEDDIELAKNDFNN